MSPTLTTRLADIERLCQRFKVARLEVFGSAGRGDFNEASSDIDLIVQFRDEQAGGLLTRYWELAEGLEKVLGWPVDLLTERMIRNPYFRAEVDAERQTIYAGESEEVVR